MWQLVFLIYRCVMSFYFLAWLVPSGVHDLNGGPKYFIFLTNWSYLLFNSYLLVAAMSTILQFIIHHTYDSRKMSRHDLFVKHNLLKFNVKEKFIRELLGADYRMEVVWYQKIQWLLGTMGLGVAVAVSILYWSVVYSSSDELDGVNLNTHFVNGIVALFDVWFSGIIIKLYHVVYILAFGVTYGMFSGIYCVVGGTNVQGKPYIYSILDFKDELGQAIVFLIITGLVYLPLVHLVMYAIYGIRYWLAKKVCKREYNESAVEQV